MIDESRLHNAIAGAITEKKLSEQGSWERIVNHIEMYKMHVNSSEIIQRQKWIAEMEKVINDRAKLNKEAAYNGEPDDHFDERYYEMHLIKDKLAEIKKAAYHSLMMKL